MAYQGFPEQPMEMIYSGQQDRDGTEYHFFVAVGEAFVLGLPDYEIGTNFTVEPSLTRIPSRVRPNRTPRAGAGVLPCPESPLGEP